MSDLIERLRDKAQQLNTVTAALITEAADELTRLRSLVDQSGGGAREALAVIAKRADYVAEGLFEEARVANATGEKAAESDLMQMHNAFTEIGNIACRALASPPHGGRILEGWRMVPVEPTDEMIAAGFEAWLDNDGKQVPAWKAMLSAAPVSPLREDQGASRAQNQQSAATSAKASDPIQVQSDG